MNDRPNPDHLKAHFTADLPAAGLPRRFEIVTAYNADGSIATEKVNKKEDAKLKRLLVAAGLLHFRATGGARLHRVAEWVERQA